MAWTPPKERLKLVARLSLEDYNVALATVLPPITKRLQDEAKLQDDVIFIKLGYHSNEIKLKVNYSKAK